MDLSLFLFLSRRVVVVESSSSSRSRARRRHRDTHQSHPTTGPSIASGRSRAIEADDAGSLSSRHSSTDPSIDRTVGRSAPVASRAGRHAEGGAGGRPNVRSVVRTFERRTTGKMRNEKWKMRRGSGIEGWDAEPYRRERYIVGFHFFTVAWGMGWGVYGDGHRLGMVWWCVGD